MIDISPEHKEQYKNAVFVSWSENHEAAICMLDVNTGKYINLETEKLTGKRFVRSATLDLQEFILLRRLVDVWMFRLEKHHPCENNARRWIQLQVAPELKPYKDSSKTWGRFMRRLFLNYKVYSKSVSHHRAHAALGYYTSPFKEAVVITVDGGGDGLAATILAKHSRKEPFVNLERWKALETNLGGFYYTMSSLCGELFDSGDYHTFSGKAMALAGMGKVRPEWYKVAWKAIHDNKMWRAGLATWPYQEKMMKHFLPYLHKAVGTRLREQDSYDWMATVQKVFEDRFDEMFEHHIDNYPGYPIVISGGCALNVVNNERLKRKYPDREIFVPSCPGDAGLPMGQLLERFRPETPPEDVTYSGLPICEYFFPTQTTAGDPIRSFTGLDHMSDPVLKATGYELISDILKDYPDVTPKEVAQMVSEGKIVGICQGRAEFGPRALGARSIICDPSIPEMKDIINAKVKGREWYRPFAPFCKKENAYKWFESTNFEHMEFMSFAPDVKEEWRDKLPSVTHFDGSSRLQTVTEQSHKYFYDVLTEFEKLTGKGVLLNTSFNIRGKAILNTMREAVFCLHNTEMDAVVIDGKLILD